MTWRKVFVRAGREKRFFLWVKVGFLNLKRLVALPEEFFGRGRRMLAIQVMKEKIPQGLYIQKALLVSLRIATHYILGLTKAKTEEGREGRELGDITSWSKI